MILKCSSNADAVNGSKAVELCPRCWQSNCLGHIVESNPDSHGLRYAVIDGPVIVKGNGIGIVVEPR